MKSDLLTNDKFQTDKQLHKWINFDHKKHSNNSKGGMFCPLIDTNRVFLHHNRTFTPCSQNSLTETTALHVIPELSQYPCNCLSDTS